MSEGSDQEGEPAAGARLEPEHLDGHTVESLSDYLDRGRSPRDPAIESSAPALHALSALERLRVIAPKLLVAEAKNHSSKSEHWIRRILDQIGLQAHAGRAIPFADDDPGAALSISEGAVRALVRQAGDGIDGLLVERVRFEGDVEEPAAPIVVEIEVSTLAGAETDAVIAQLEHDVRATLAKHTELNIERLSVAVRDPELTDSELTDSELTDSELGKESG